MVSSGINLVMTVIGFAVSILFIVFVCTRLIFAKIHGSITNGFVGADLSTLERHGIEPLMIANFPTKKFSDDFFSSSVNTRCTICLADYHKDDILRVLPSCGHSFHSSCIDVWLLQHSTCPVCRISLRDFTEKKRLMQPLSSAAAQYHYGNNSGNVDDQFSADIVGTDAGATGCHVHGCDQGRKALGNKHVCRIPTNLMSPLV